MNAQLAQFFEKSPAALPVYLAFEQAVLGQFPHANIRVQKTQISFSEQFGFCCASLPRRKSDCGLLVSFGLPQRLEHPRVMYASQISAHRWTHHVLVPDAGAVDRQLLEWIRSSWHLSHQK